MRLFGFKPFFRRQQEIRGEVPSTFVYELSQKVRVQILMLWRDILHFNEASEILKKIHLELGTIQLCNYQRVSRHELNSEFLNNIAELCSYFEEVKDHEMAFTILELICYAHRYHDLFIDSVNSRLRIEAVGYRFVGRDVGQLRRVEDEMFYDECVERCLSVLGASSYRDVLSHYMNSYKELKDGHYDDALVDLRQAVESLLKTRFDILNISYDAKKDTYSKLLQIAQDHIDSGPYKFHHFKEMIQSVGSASNAGGHGQTQGQAFNVDEIYVRFMINQAAANLLFLAEVPMKP